MNGLGSITSWWGKGGPGRRWFLGILVGVRRALWSFFNLRSRPDRLNDARAYHRSQDKVRKVNYCMPGKW